MNSQHVYIFTPEEFVDVITMDMESRKQQGRPDDTWDYARKPLEHLASYTASGKDVLLLNKLVGDLGGVGAQAYIKHYGGKPHIILKGYPGLRKILNAPKYGANNVKVVQIGLGKHGAINAAKTGAVLTIILMSAYRVVDFFLRDGVTLAQLVGTLATDVVKVGLATGASIVAAIAVASIPGVIGSVAIGPLVAVILVGMGTAYVLGKLDEHYGMTEKVIAALEDFEELANTKFMQGREMMLDVGQYARDKAEEAKRLPGRVAQATAETLLELAERKVKNYILQSVDRLLRRMPSLFF